MQPKIKAKVQCVDGEVGEVAHVVVDPLHVGVSHVVVKTPSGERLIPIDGNLVNGEDGTILLNVPSSALASYPGFRREEYVRLEEVEIAHAERHLDVIPGEILVPIPSLEKGTDRRSFFRNFMHVLGAVLALPLVYPVLRYLLHPMYPPFDNRWLPIGSVNQLSEPDFPRLLRFSKKLKEGYLMREFQKSHWAVKASPATLESIYGGKELSFYNEKGEVIWTNQPDQSVVVFSGKCPHLGCAYKWRNTRKWGRAFVCPCHLSVFEKTGEVIDGPSPRPLDVLPVRVDSAGTIEVIDMEFKAGREYRIRVV